ncbi:peptidase domain-containing ABC transporter [uncultured Propionivibrio sp.]|uniref:peptidase domain-containing ABC transporter n=1 Tax=uncultured Propionivibrio sp. TaxID=426737 RepID=UPI0029C0B30B|nr:peptidase domain-containing ABC transporter [uncultured Propionivibrio sp.]
MVNGLLRWFRRLPASARGGRVGAYSFGVGDFVWSLGSFCALRRIPYDPQLLLRQFPPPHGEEALIRAARALGFRIGRRQVAAESVKAMPLPALVVMRGMPDGAPSGSIHGASREFSLSIIVDADDDKVLMLVPGGETVVQQSSDVFAQSYLGTAYLLSQEVETPADPDGDASGRSFGFRWFMPELARHGRVWRDVLLASLTIQLLALATPLFTQTIIDKVVVHRSESTLIVIGIGLCIFMIFSSILTWVRQFLVLHTGNRVDAVLGAAVFDHLFKLPPRYFEHRPTGVIAARLNGVETIREFIAGAAITLMLDLPFLCIFVAIMFYYSVSLTCVALALIGVVVAISLTVAPVFRARLDDQFHLGARNQAFITEYVAGIETVKSLQMEPLLNERYGNYLADYLRAGFRLKQTSNTYNVIANTVEQLMTVLILVVGAYQVMRGSDLTIGMLVAFQMFAGRVSQPMLRLVGLWQQFQQASLSVRRLGDIMNAPSEPYSIRPTRTREGAGKIQIRGLAFRYDDARPFLYEGFDLDVSPGSTVAITGPSGSGKSTLAKLLLGFYLPTAGTIRIDDNDIRHLSANELRATFGVVPQETTLFSGPLYDNLMMANPHADFDAVVAACRMAEIHEVIEQLPQGYQTRIGERGVGLSGGQKQRLAIARALLKRPKVLIFDEATSALDPVTAEHFAATINQLRGRVTMLFITHALPRSLKIDVRVRIGSGSDDESVCCPEAGGGVAGAKP